MTERYATQTGNYSAASTWDGNTLPQAGDTVHPNGYTVTIDQNVTVTALSTRAGAVAAGGGYFALTNTTAGFTITADIYGGTARCLLDSHTTGTIYIVGNVYGSDTTGSEFGLNKSGVGLTVLTGNAYAGTVVNSTAISLSGASNASFIMYGNCYASTITAASSHGIAFSCAGTSTCIVYGNVYGGTVSSNSYGISNGSTSATASVTVYGNVYGSAAPGIRTSQDANTYIYGDAIGGAGYLVAGATLHTSAVGNCYVYGTARSSPTGLGPGVANNSTGAAIMYVHAAETGAGGGWPILGKVIFNDLANIAFGVRNAAGTLKTIGVLPHSSFSTPRAFT